MCANIINASKVCLLFWVLVSAGCDSRLELEERYLEKAQSLMDQGKYEQALLDLDIVLKINPENAYSRYLKALIATKEGQYNTAQSLLRKVVFIQPDFHDAQTLLGQLYLDWDEDPDLALTQANLVLEKDNENLKAMNLKANISMWKGEKVAAESMAKKILHLDPDNLSADKLLVRIYGSDRAFAKAVNLIDSILKKYPDELDLYFLKINYLVKSNDLLNAEHVFQAMLSKFPQEQEIYTELIEFYVQAGRLDNAERVHRQLIAQFPERTGPKLQFISFLLANDNEALAEHELKEFIKNEPDKYRFQFLLASLYQDQPELANKILTNIASKNEFGVNGLKARNILARQALEQGDNDKARRLVEVILEKDPINPESLLIRSGLLLNERKYSAAIRDLRTMIRDNPDSEEALMLLAEAHTVTHRPDLAKDIYRKVLKINPENSIAIKKMADLTD